MYALLFGALFVGGGFLIHKGAVAPQKLLWGYALIALGLLLIIAMEFSAELLWYEALSFTDRFWTFLLAQTALVVVAALIAGGLPALILKSGVLLARYVMLISGVVGVIWAFTAWSDMLLFIQGVSTGIHEPLFGLDTGFYLFTLPFLDRVFWLGLSVALIVLVSAILFDEGVGVLRVAGRIRQRTGGLLLPRASLGFAVVLAYGQILGVYHLLYSELGVVMGPGWTDIYVRFPALILMGLVFVVAGILPFIEGFRGFMRRQVARFDLKLPADLTATLGAWLAISIAWIVLVLLLPALVQWLVVKPNEITFEAPYIARNIEYTRAAFKLDQIEERQFSADAKLDQRSMDDNEHLLSEVRLWDWQALDAVYKQFQEIRLYYEFVDVDIDRYQIDGRYRQVMVAARELAKQNLPEQSQTFVNQRFKYTHGYGITLAPVSDFSDQGLPNLLVKNIPPVSQHASLEVKRPEIYYGELTSDPVIVKTKELEFDYPSGEKNVYSTYEGRGGVQLLNWWRKFVFGWKFDGTVFLLSSYPTEESRVMFHRQVGARVQRIAPFLDFDEDPYIVLVDGRLKWIVDGYTSSSYYPYSQAFDSREHVGDREGQNLTSGTRTVSRLDGKNYVRNSVKAVVDAYDGSVEFFVFDEEDPIIATWRKIVPDLFKERDAMPDNLRRHVRYPQDLLLTQGLIFTRYHMTDPEVFYNQEDVWVRATEKHYHRVQPVEPYYVMWALPGSEEAEFVLMLPFTPKGRQVLIGWIAALSDGDNYGRFIAYKFPKERRVLGPQQVETKIDQDPFLSGQLTLWDQQGSEVIRGNVLAIPIDDSLLYVEPIYLRAETAAYPELRLVAVMQGDVLSYAETFEEAMLGLIGEAIPEPTSDKIDVLVAEAQKAFTGYLTAQGAGQFEEAAVELRRLSELLQQMKNRVDNPIP